MPLYPATSKGIVTRIRHGELHPRVAAEPQSFGGRSMQSHEVHCTGCPTPHPQCAACGGPTRKAVLHHDGNKPHYMTFCARCWRTVLAVRAASRTKEPLLVIEVAA